MTQLDLTADHLVVTLRGWDPLWALKRRIAVPWAHVRGATADPGMAREPTGLRWPGTHVPRVITAGTYHRDGERVFYALRASQQPLVVELTGERYTRLVLGVEDARSTADRVEQALSRR